MCYPGSSPGRDKFLYFWKSIFNMPLQVSELRNKALRFAVQRGLRFDGRDIIGISGKKLKITFNEEYPSINFIMNGKLYHLRVHRIKAYILYELS